MNILIDSREQHSLLFDEYDIVSGVEVVKLNVGDYGARFTDGHRPPLYFERKSKADLWGTLTKTENHERFKREIGRAKSDGSELVLLVECSLTSILKGHTYQKDGVTRCSRYSGAAMIAQLFTLRIKYQLEMHFLRNREEMERYVVESYRAYGKLYLKRLDKAKKENKVKKGGMV